MLEHLQLETFFTPLSSALTGALFGFLTNEIYFRRSQSAQNRTLDQLKHDIEELMANQRAISIIQFKEEESIPAPKAVELARFVGEIQDLDRNIFNQEAQDELDLHMRSKRNLSLILLLGALIVALVGAVISEGGSDSFAGIGAPIAGFFFVRIIVQGFNWRELRSSRKEKIVQKRTEEMQKKARDKISKISDFDDSDFFRLFSLIQAAPFSYMNKDDIVVWIDRRKHQLKELSS